MREVAAGSQAVFGFVCCPTQDLCYSVWINVVGYHLLWAVRRAPGSTGAVDYRPLHCCYPPYTFPPAVSFLSGVQRPFCRLWVLGDETAHDYRYENQRSPHGARRLYPEPLGVGHSRDGVQHSATPPGCSNSNTTITSSKNLDDGRGNQRGTVS